MVCLGHLSTQVLIMSSKLFLQQSARYFASANAEQSILSHWQQVIAQGNQAFQATEYQQALSEYQRAEQLSAQGMTLLLQTELAKSDQHEFAELLAAWVVTMHNIADCFVAQSLHQQAACQLYAAYEAMLRLAHHHNIFISNAAARHGQKCYQQWLMLEPYVMVKQHHDPAISSLLMGQVTLH